MENLSQENAATATPTIPEATQTQSFPPAPKWLHNITTDSSKLQFPRAPFSYLHSDEDDALHNTMWTCATDGHRIVMLLLESDAALIDATEIQSFRHASEPVFTYRTEDEVSYRHYKIRREDLDKFADPKRAVSCSWCSGTGVEPCHVDIDEDLDPSDAPRPLRIAWIKDIPLNLNLLGEPLFYLPGEPDEEIHIGLPWASALRPRTIVFESPTWRILIASYDKQLPERDASQEPQLNNAELTAI